MTAPMHHLRPTHSLAKRVRMKLQERQRVTWVVVVTAVSAVVAAIVAAIAVVIVASSG